ncbi:MAG: HEPN domain-containing protein [Candidatus Woesearchaeota archaeon]
MKIGQLIEKGLLRKSTPDLEKARQSLKVAKAKLEEARRSLDAKIYEGTIVFAYMSMFHAARAILFSDGYTEKSHFAVIAYLEEKHTSTLRSDMISRFNTLRSQRHECLYGLEAEFSEEDAIQSIADAKEFLRKVEQMIGPG